MLYNNGFSLHFKELLRLAVGFRDAQLQRAPKNPLCSILYILPEGPGFYGSINHAT